MIVIDKWSGLVTNGSPYALPPGAAAVQVNFQCLRPGEIDARGGQTAATFSSHSPGSVQIVEMFRCPIGAQESVVYQNSSGHIFVAKGLQ